MRLKVFIFLFVFFIFPFYLRAANFYFSPQTRSVERGDVFLTKLYMDTEGEFINAAELVLKFPKECVVVEDFILGGSIFTFWPKMPEIDEEKGEVGFIGGVPGGYWGKDGLIGSLVVRASNVCHDQRIDFLTESKALVNDGHAGEAVVKFNSLVFDVEEGDGIIKNEWQELRDTVLPESFKIGLEKNEIIGGGRYFIYFFTTDKQSGIDHYEVKEGNGEWLEAESPYLLKDQEMSGEIRVKAVDKNGNERVELLDRQVVSAKEGIFRAIWFRVILVIIVLFGFVFIFVKFSRKK